MEWYDYERPINDPIALLKATFGNRFEINITNNGDVTELYLNTGDEGINNGLVEVSFENTETDIRQKAINLIIRAQELDITSENIGTIIVTKS